MSTGTAAARPARATAASDPSRRSLINGGTRRSALHSCVAHMAANCVSRCPTISSMTLALGYVAFGCGKYLASSAIPGTVSFLIQFLIPALYPIQALALAIRYVLVVVQSRPAACFTRRMSVG